MFQVYFSKTSSYSRMRLYASLSFIACPQAVSSGSRCGPDYGGGRCNKTVHPDAIYCNSENGWCGNTDAHKDAQPDEDIYDWQPTSCRCMSCN